MHKPPRRAAADDELNTNAHGGISLVFIRAGIPRFGVVGLIIIIAYFDQKINSTKKNRADARKQKKTKHKKHLPQSTKTPPKSTKTPPKGEKNTNFFFPRLRAKKNALFQKKQLFLLLGPGDQKRFEFPLWWWR